MLIRRKKSGNAREHRVQLRFTQQEFALLRDKAGKQPVATWARIMLLKIPLTPVPVAISQLKQNLEMWMSKREEVKRAMECPDCKGWSSNSLCARCHGTGIVIV